MAPRPLIRARAATLAALGLCLAGSGCAWAPRSRVDEAHRLVQTLRTENAQLKDSALSLRVQNQELAQRAVDDARALKALELANQQFEQSIQGYQDEREAMRTAFRDVERMARGDGSSAPRAGRSPARSEAAESLAALAQATPGGRFDPATGVLSVDASALFARGSRRLSAEGSRWLDEVAVQVADRVTIRLGGGSATTDPAVRTVATTGGLDASVAGLNRDRCQAIRQAIATRSGVAADRVRVEGSPPGFP